MGKSFKKQRRKFDDDFEYGVDNNDNHDARDKKHKNRDERRSMRRDLKNLFYNKDKDST